jgi:hypothetical protein
MRIRHALFASLVPVALVACGGAGDASDSNETSEAVLKPPNPPPVHPPLPPPINLPCGVQGGPCCQKELFEQCDGQDTPIQNAGGTKGVCACGSACGTEGRLACEGPYASLTDRELCNDGLIAAFQTNGEGGTCVKCSAVQSSITVESSTPTSLTVRFNMSPPVPFHISLIDYTADMTIQWRSFTGPQAAAAAPQAFTGLHPGSKYGFTLQAAGTGSPHTCGVSLTGEITTPTNSGGGGSSGGSGGSGGSSGGGSGGGNSCADCYFNCYSQGCFAPERYCTADNFSAASQAHPGCSVACLPANTQPACGVPNMLAYCSACNVGYPLKGCGC